MKKENNKIDYKGKKISNEYIKYINNIKKEGLYAGNFEVL